MPRDTNTYGIESVLRDYRGHALPAGLPRHLLGAHAGQHPDVLQACPRCGLGVPEPFCPCCLGGGLVTNDRLDRYLMTQTSG